MGKYVGCGFVAVLWVVFIVVVGFYDVYKIAQLAARQEIAASRQGGK